MDKFTKIITVVLGVFAIVFGTLYFATPTQVINQNVQPVGAVPVLNSPVEVNGHQIFYDRKIMTQSTSTPCTFRSSTAASSTLRYFSARFTSATTTSALFVEIGKSATPYATTTSIVTERFDASAKATVYATTSAGVIGIKAATQFAPGDYLVVKVAAPDAATNIHNDPTGFKPVGVCNVEWQADN